MSIAEPHDSHQELASQDAEYARLLRQDPRQVDAWRMRSRLALQRRDNAAAAQLLEEALRHNPNEPALLEDLARLHLLRRAPDAARPLVKQLIGSGSSTPEHAFFQGRLAWLEGDHESAIGFFRQAVERQPDESRFLTSLVQSLVSLDQLPEALRYIARFGATGGSAEMLSLIALYRFDTSGAEMALEAVRYGLQQSPVHPTLRYLYAALNILAGRPEEAESSIAIIENDETMGPHWRGFTYAQAQRGATFCGLESTVLRRSLTEAPSTGGVAEFGVYHGLSLRRLAQQVATPLHGFDSFEGIPEDWKPGEPKGSYSTGGRVPEMPAHVTLHRGWFEDTLPGFVASQQEPLRFVHVDCDLYSSTRTVLEGLRPLLQLGTVLLFDEYLGFEGYEQHEFRAWQEFVKRHGIRYEYVAFELIAKQAAVRITQL
ncbi:MAG TPA: tetratricopeptide repeat protein [Gammaproteobacteria bacterium]|nr:tetratricopeptide repeat protein [Gammaproteobacteria bacterium]